MSREGRKIETDAFQKYVYYSEVPVFTFVICFSCLHKITTQDTVFQKTWAKSMNVAFILSNLLGTDYYKEFNEPKYCGADDNST